MLKQTVILVMLVATILISTIRCNAQERQSWWRPTLAYKKDWTLDTAKTSANIISRHRQLWNDDTTVFTVTPDIITSLIEIEKKNKTTKYKKGFKYVENTNGIPVQYTLLKWIPTGTDFNGLLTYRWRTRGYITLIHRSFFAYTDDIFLDINTGKAYVDEYDHRVKYYNSKDNSDSLPSKIELVMPLLLP